MAQSQSNFTRREAANIQLGQCRSAWIDDGTEYTIASGEVIVAITIIQDAKFNKIEQEDPANCFGDLGVDNTYAGGIGSNVAATTLIPAGITLFGRWETIDLAAGVVVLYMAGK